MEALQNTISFELCILNSLEILYTVFKLELQIPTR